MKLADLINAPRLGEAFPLPLDQPFRTDSAIANGIHAAWLTAMVDSGHLRRLTRGVYVAGQVPDSTALRIAALKLVVPDGAVVCDRHAGWLHGAEMVLAPNEHIDLAPIRIFRAAGRTRLRHAIIDGGERALLARDVEEIDGLRVTTPIRTAWDLGRVPHPVQAISGIDAMLRSGGVSREELIAGIERFKGERWVRTLRTVAPLAHPGSESPPESAAKYYWHAVTGEVPDLQIEIVRHGAAFAFLDLGSRSARFAIEYDGVEWHSSPDQIRHDRDRRGIITREFDFEIRPVVAENLYGRQRDIESIIWSGLRRSRRRIGLVG